MLQKSFSIVCDYVLVLAGEKLILFTVSSAGLCFGFVLKMWLIMQRFVFSLFVFSLLCKQRLHKPRPPLAPLHQQGGWDCTRRWKQDTTYIADPSCPQGILYHMASCLPINDRGGTRKQEWCWDFGLCHYYLCWSPAFLGREAMN